MEMIKNTALLQEINVFKALCPASLMHKIQNTNLCYVDYIKIVNMFNALGFEDLALFFLAAHFDELYEKTKILLKINSNVEIEKFYALSGENFSEKEFTAQFIKNIKSAGLRDLFEKKVDYL